MKLRSLHHLALAAATATVATSSAAGATAYMFWNPPNFAGAPVQGGEPGIGQALPGAKPAELEANMLWSMRAGLNVAALQCQFAPALATVKNYNVMLKQHATELNGAYQTISAYFKRTGGKTWQTQLDQYTTRTYNGFSTLHAQLGFCDTAASIGREVLARPRGALHLTAETRMREFRNSLVPAGDVFVVSDPRTQFTFPTPRELSPDCWDRKNRFRDSCLAS